MRRLASLGLTATFVAVALAACNSTETNDFAAEADRLCTDAAIEEEARREIGSMRRAADVAAWMGEVARVRAELAEEIGALEPPIHSPRAAGELAAVEEGAANSAQRASSARSPAALRRSLGAFTKRDEQVREVARRLGLEECAGVLREPTREELEEVIVELMPPKAEVERLCDSLLSKRFVAELFGGPDDCRRSARDLLPLSRDSVLTRVVGVADVRVEAVVGPPRAIGLRFVFEDGRYKLDGIGEPGQATYRFP